VYKIESINEMSAVNQLDVGALVEMGFNRERVTEALQATKNNGIPPALEWLFNHPIADPSSGQKLGGETTQSDSVSTPTDNSTTSGGSTDSPSGGETDAIPAAETDTQPQQVLSLKCEDCGKLIKSEMDAQSHAARTGHQNFAESTEEIKPLTEEEKQAQKEKLQQKLEERRKQRVVEEKKEALAREKSRRRTGKEITQAKEDHEHQEMKRIAEERRREKLEEIRIKKKLKEEIAKDRADFKAKNQSTSASPSRANVTPTPTNTPVEVKKKEYDTCRIQFRQTDGKTINETFKASDTLQNVHLYIAEHRTDSSIQPFSLSTSFPRKTFQTEDMSKTLVELKLVPSSVLILGKL